MDAGSQVVSLPSARELRRASSGHDAVTRAAAAGASAVIAVVQLKVPR